MADTLATLIRLAERQVEAAQRALNATRQKRADIRAAIVKLHEEEVAAFVQGMADDTVQGLQAASAFQERVRRETARLEEADTALATQEQTDQKTLQTAYGQQKRYELLHARTLQRAKAEAAKKAQHALDEAASHITR